MFGGDDNWNKLLAVHAGSFMYKWIGLGNRDAAGSMAYLERLITDGSADPATSPKSIREYSFEVKANIRGKKLQIFSPLGVCSNGAIVIPLGDTIRKFSDEEERVGDRHQVNMSVRTFRTSSGEFASLVQTPTMRVANADGIHLEAETSYGAVYNYRHMVDAPDAEARVPIFWTKTGIIRRSDDGKPFLLVFFFDGSNEPVVHPARNLDVMERLNWK